MIYPVTPEHCTVLGYAVKAAHPMWQGLDLSDCVTSEQAVIEVYLAGKDAPLDDYLCVAFAWPGEPPEDWAGCRYRIRPRRKYLPRNKRARFFQDNGAWFFEVMG